MKFKLSYLLAPLLVLAGFLRFYQLGFNSLWLDEVVTWVLSRGSLWDIFGYMTRGEYNPPLFYWVEHFIIPVLGSSEAALRFMPAVFGILTLIPAYLLGKRIGGEVTGILSTLMVTVSVFAIYFSQEARAYTLFMLLFVAGLYCYLEALDYDPDEGDVDPDNWVKWTGAIIFFAGSIWAHFYALVFITVALVCTPLILKKGKELMASWRYWVIFMGLVTPILGFVGFLFLRRETQELANGLQGLDVIQYGYVSLMGSAMPIAIIFLILIGWSVVFKPSREKWFLLAVAVLPIFIGVPVSPKITILPRYFAPAAVILFVLIADAWRSFTFNNVTEPNRYMPKVYSVIFVLLISLNLFTLPLYYGVMQKDDWKGMVGFLDTQTQPGDHVVSVPAYRLDWELKYYYDNTTRGTVLLGAYNISDVQAACQAAQTVVKYFNFTKACQEWGDPWECIQGNLSAGVDTETINHACYIIVTQDNTGHYTGLDVQYWIDTHAKHLRDFGPGSRDVYNLPLMKVYEMEG